MSTQYHSIKSLLVTTVAISTLATGCLSSEEEAALQSAFLLNETLPISVPIPEPECFNERFTQATEEISRSIDILFVMDTSGSMKDNRAKVADGISAFVSELPSDVDYQVGVLLAHGSKSTWSGKLFTYKGSTIFSSENMQIETIRAKLKEMVLYTPSDSSGEQGEQGSYSLMKALTTRFETNVNLGFFRSNAALAVVFVSDENDICAPYAGMTKTPGLTSSEKTIRNRDCPGGIATDAVISQVKQIQGERPYLFGAVVHKDVNYSDKSGNDGYGWGYMEIVNTTNGVSTEINNGDYTEGLSDMGKLATRKLELVLDYSLARTEVDPETILAFVDGVETGFTFDAILNEVHLSDGGRSASTIDINYCLKTAIPGSDPNDPGSDPNDPGSDPSDPDPEIPCLGLECGGGVIGV